MLKALKMQNLSRYRRNAKMRDVQAEDSPKTIAPECKLKAYKPNSSRNKVYKSYKDCYYEKVHIVVKPYKPQKDRGHEP